MEAFSLWEAKNMERIHLFCFFVTVSLPGFLLPGGLHHKATLQLRDWLILSAFNFQTFRPNNASSS